MIATLNRHERRQQDKLMRRGLVQSPAVQPNIRPAVAICIPFEESVYATWVTNGFTNVLNDMQPQDELHTNEGAFIDVARDHLSRGAMKTDAEYIFWVDSDTTPPKGALDRLLSHKKDIVGGWYRVKHGKHPCVYDFARFNEEKGWREYKPRPECPSDESAPKCHCGKQHSQQVEAVDGLGFGCMLIHRRVFEAINERWFTTQYGTEDLHFEWLAKQAGFLTHVDWGLHAAHVGVFSV